MKRDKQYFQGQIDVLTDDYMSKSRVAPQKGGYDPFFKKPIESKFQLKRAWVTAVQDIIDIAKVYGISFNSLGVDKPVPTLSDNLDDLG